MEIRDPIHGSVELTPAETAVIDDRFFQRLRNIKQMGFGEFSFPGATHNRYCHSVGAMHLAGLAFDNIFQGFSFSSKEQKWRLRQAVRLASLLHDVGHGPLSHTTEEVMPPLSELRIKIYKKKETRKANHEDFTIKIVTDSPFTETLQKFFPDLQPEHVATLIDKDLPEADDFFSDKGISFRPLLSQIVSSELDVDRMDYLSRDSYYCGTSYGHVDLEWILSSLTFYQNNGQYNLALNRRALYTFDDFLISRYHMYLMVYFHHKGIVYDEMLLRYLRSEDCDFFLPSDILEYVEYDDHKLHTQMNQSKNQWAKLIARRQPYRMLYESHDQSNSLEKWEKTLKSEGMEVIRAGSKGRLSKYYGGTFSSSPPIFVIDKESKTKKRVSKIEESTEIFQKYQTARKIERLYVSREDFEKAQKILELT